MIGLHHVAKLAGVSKSTVSRVINNEYGVKKSTKEKVQKAIAESGYVVNQVAKDLKSQKTNLVGVIVPRMSSNATARGFDGLSDIFENAQKQVLIANSKQLIEKEIEFIRLFNQKRVEGILLYATNLDLLLAKEIKQSSCPVILIGQDASLYDIPSIIHDDFRVGVQAGDRLLASGADRIGFIGVNAQDISVDSLRYQGLVASLSQKGKSPIFHAHGEFSIDSGFEQMSHLLLDYPDVNGVFCATDRIALGAMRALIQSGKEPGKDVHLLGVGDDELAQISRPGLSSFRYPFRYAGEVAATMLLDLIKGEDKHMSKIVLSSDVVTRETCQ